jgi:SAM-dependent methyltransferase
MTDKDRIKWDAKYRQKPISSDPSNIVTKYWHLATPGKALDIASGGGRNSIFLAQNGFSVDAVDISMVAAERLEGLHVNIQVLCEDLDSWKIPRDQYDLIINIRFLDRKLFPQIQAGLKNGGLLIFESFVNGETDKYCLFTNELLHVFSNFRIVFYEEKKTKHGEKYDRMASLVAFKTDAAMSNGG